MFDPNLLNQIKDQITKAASVLILLPPNPDEDSISASLGLKNALESNQKNCHIGCSTPQDDPFIDSHIGNQTLVVSFAYQEDAVENVSYDIDDTSKKFNLRIQPRANANPLSASDVQFSYTGASADLVITFGVSSLEELGRLYSEEKAFLDQANIIKLALGKQISTATMSEAVLILIKALNLSLNSESASEFYQQLVKSTSNFSSPAVTADTFETAAYLLRNGAQKLGVRPLTPMMTSPFPPQPLIENDLSANLPPQPTPKFYRGGSPLK